MLCRCSVATLLESWSLSLVCRWFIAVTGLSLVHHCSVTGLSLVHRCHWSVAGSSLLCSGHSRWSWSLIVRHCSACSSFCWSVTAVTDLSARAMVTDPSVVCRSFAPRPSDRPSLLVCPLLRLLVCLLARRLSVCWPVACLSAGPSLLVRRFPVCLSVCWPVAARPSLTHCWSACLSITGCHCPVPVRGRWSVSSSVSSRLLVRLLVHRSSLVRRWSVAGPLLVRLLVHRSSLVGLLGSGSLPRGWSAARLSLTRGWSWSLVRLLVRRALLSRCSACLSITGLSARPLLSCLLFVHQSVCSSHGRWLVARPSAARRCSVYWSRNWPVPGLSARSSLVHLITHRSSVYSSLTGLSTRLSRVCLFVSHGSYRWSVCSLVTGPWVRVMSLVRLFESWSLVCILDSSLAFSCVAGLPLVR